MGLDSPGVADYVQKEVQAVVASVAIPWVFSQDLGFFYPTMGCGVFHEDFGFFCGFVKVFGFF